MDLMLLRRRLIPVETEEDLSDLFIYTISNNLAIVTGVKSNKWYERFGNYDIIVPSKIEGCAVVIKA